MTAREKLIELILSASPEELEYLCKLMLTEGVTSEASTTPRTVPQ